MSKFDLYLLEAEAVNSVTWDKPLFHGTSLAIAKKILKLKQFSYKDTNGVNEIGRGVYTHPSMNRTSPWVHLTSKGKEGAFIKIVFKRPLKLAIPKRGISQREYIEQGFDGTYDKEGNTQIPHQVLLFTSKPIGMDLDDLNSDLIDWSSTSIVPYDDNIHGYLNASKEEKLYY